MLRAYFASYPIQVICFIIIVIVIIIVIIVIIIIIIIIIKTFFLLNFAVNSIRFHPTDAIICTGILRHHFVMSGMYCSYSEKHYYCFVV